MIEKFLSEKISGNNFGNTQRLKRVCAYKAPKYSLHRQFLQIKKNDSRLASGTREFVTSDHLIAVFGGDFLQLRGGKIVDRFIENENGHENQMITASAIVPDFFRHARGFEEIFLGRHAESDFDIGIIARRDTGLTIEFLPATLQSNVTGRLLFDIVHIGANVAINARAVSAAPVAIGLAAFLDRTFTTAACLYGNLNRTADRFVHLHHAADYVTTGTAFRIFDQRSGVDRRKTNGFRCRRLLLARLMPN